MQGNLGTEQGGMTSLWKEDAYSLGSQVMFKA